MEPEIDDFAAQNECEVVGKFVSMTKIFTSKTGLGFSEKFFICSILISNLLQTYYIIYLQFHRDMLPFVHIGRFPLFGYEVPHALSMGKRLTKRA